MPELFTKPLEAIDSADVRGIIGWPESLIVEYKVKLPEPSGLSDPWYAGGKVGQYALDELFKEVVAFANTSGGHLILGIAETKERPPLAGRIMPVPKCVDLADQLGKAAQAIDPPIPLLQVWGHPAETDGSGVVIFRVPPSRSAPHRGTDRNVYVRRVHKFGASIHA